MSQNQVGLWVQKESGRSSCFLPLGSEPQQQLLGLIVSSQYSILGGCFHNMVLHTEMPGFLLLYEADMTASSPLM